MNGEVTLCSGCRNPCISMFHRGPLKFCLECVRDYDQPTEEDEISMIMTPMPTLKEHNKRIRSQTVKGLV